LAAERTREASRLEKELEDAGIKLSAVATDILGVSVRSMIEAMIEGEQDVHVLAEMAKTRMRSKIPDLVQALTGNFRQHHAFLCRMHLQCIDQITAAIVEVSARIEEEMRPFARQLELLQTIPGIGQSNAEVIIAETGADMTRFRTAGNLASWAGTTPGTTSPRANDDPAEHATATAGCPAPWESPRCPPGRPRTPTSAPATADSSP
jgi:transposase